MHYTVRTTRLDDGRWEVFNSYDRHLGYIVLKPGSVKHGRSYLLFVSECGLEQGDLSRLNHAMGALRQELEASGVMMK